jgi:hypothetical protein
MRSSKSLATNAYLSAPQGIRPAANDAAGPCRRIEGEERRPLPRTTAPVPGQNIRVNLQCSSGVLKREEPILVLLIRGVCRCSRRSF